MTSPAEHRDNIPSPNPRLSMREIFADIVASTAEVLILVFGIVAFPAAVSAAIFIALTLGLPHIGLRLELLSKGLITAAAYLGMMVLMMLVEGRLLTGERVAHALERLILGRHQ